MHFTKIYETTNKRFYKFDMELSRGILGSIRPTKYVVISDASFVERLVFAFYFTNGFDETSFFNNSRNFLRVDRLHIEGSLNISMSKNFTAIYPDEYYLNNLILINE